MRVGSILTLRNFVGAFLFMVLVGELQVGALDQTFSAFGVVLYIMYFLIFLLFEAITNQYRLANYQIFLLGFAFYAVFVTGFLHAEIASYVLQPSDDLITTLIRLQSSTFIFYAYVLLNRFLPRKESDKPVSLRTAAILFALYVLALTPSRSYGLIALLTTIAVAPAQSVFFGILGAIALYYALKRTDTAAYRNKALVYASMALFLIGLIPSVDIILVYYPMMIALSAILLLNKNFRNGTLLV